MSDVMLDDRGRLALPSDVRERDGDRYHVVQLPGGVTLVPRADDPLEALRDEFSDVEKPADELRDKGREAAVNNSGSGSR
ncbi:hypothetical protein EL22_12870 [Halostagnicola sp. A56]|uniref:AbrB/MazE/SpoVT family DNA-binding domain-containing protein n=1 Tax=Halostagnicola sp. A56 TaxID=1495067 RepID=UPI0004A04202|nr:hypothetical protein [Halostagnicola sp. A56]KDE60057.1 hypothetical protein EL22_12870 [Halostagnicola sp. A56]